MRRHTKLSTTKYGVVKKTWQDWECDQITEAKYSHHVRSERHKKRQQQLGGRVVYDV